MQINTEVKGNLARLLATENLTVEHRKVSTASFDVNNRVLVLPIWKTASSTVYDLLVGHEVGHALYTPNEDPKANKAFVNVLEDARIERMMKVTYPGLRKSFFEGYRELNHQDFFGIADEDVNELALIDRINLYFKGSTDIQFTIEEEIFVNRASQTKSFDEVVDLANDLFTYAKGQEDKKEEELKSKQKELDLNELADGDPQEVDDDLDWGDDGDGDGEGDGESDDYDQDPDGGIYDNQEDYEESKTNTGGVVDETVSETESALRQALETLVDDDARDWIYLDLPKIDIDKVITPYQEIQEDLHYHFEGQACRDVEDYNYIFGNYGYAKDHYKQYKKEAQRSVNYLVKQFEMKKSADQYKRAAVSKTGVINTNSLYKYKLTEDIFKRTTVVPDGKNHGLIMYLDWSGSMQHNLLDTLKQTYNLIWFCRKAGIPFRVYAFQNATHGGDLHNAVEQKKNTLSLIADFKLLEFFSSQQNAKSLERSMELVYCQAFAMNNGRIRYMHKYTLGGTPLGEAVLCARELVKRLKKIENVTKVNVVSLTDGESNPLTYQVEKPTTDYDDLYTEAFGETDLWTKHMCRSSRFTKFILRDPETGYVREFDAGPYSTTREIVSFFKEITDYNWIGIRICSKSELKRVCRSLTFDQSVSVDKQWRKDKFASIKETTGFTEAFFMPDKNIGVGTQELQVNQKGEEPTRAELSRAFKKHMGSKMANKTILNAFIEQIA